MVNTRPTHQAESLGHLIRQAGGTLVEFPVIEISPPLNSDSLHSQIGRIHEADLAIFISANAVDAVMTLLGSVKAWPENLRIASVGRATASKLEAYGLVASIIAPEPFNSEALLSLPVLEDLSSKKVIIIRGEGGRELLAETLLARGAEVEYLECYRRHIPSSDPAALYQCWDENRKLVIVVTSNEGLRNLTVMVDSEHQQNLLTSTLVVISERAVSLASELGFKQKPVLSDTVSNEAIIDAIQQWQGHH